MNELFQRSIAVENLDPEKPAERARIWTALAQLASFYTELRTFAKGDELSLPLTNEAVMVTNTLDQLLEGCGYDPDAKLLSIPRLAPNLLFKPSDENLLERQMAALCIDQMIILSCLCDHAAAANDLVTIYGSITQIPSRFMVDVAQIEGNGDYAELSVADTFKYGESTKNYTAMDQLATTLMNQGVRNPWVYQYAAWANHSMGRTDRAYQLYGMIRDVAPNTRVFTHMANAGQSQIAEYRAQLRAYTVRRINYLNERNAYLRREIAQREEKYTRLQSEYNDLEREVAATTITLYNEDRFVARGDSLNAQASSNYEFYERARDELQENLAEIKQLETNR